MNIRYLAIVFLIVLPCRDAFADPAKGLEVAILVDEADSGWKDEEVQAKMTLVAANGRTVTRVLRTRSLEVTGDGDRSLVVFDRPRDVKGTVFLTHAHKKGNDDQWLFLPSLKRVKRISSSNRSGPFMGSEYAYKDISSEEVERYTYDYLGSERVAGLECHVYERVPVDLQSGYSRQVVYADTDHFRVLKIEYYDRKGSHQKTLTRTDYRKIGSFWRAGRWEMVNHLNKKKTIVDWHDWKFATGLTRRQFEKNALVTYR